jgi:hypothetical protein
MSKKSVESINREKAVIDILGVKFSADMYQHKDTHILTLCPQGKWSMSRSTSLAKEICIFKRSR